MAKHEFVSREIISHMLCYWCGSGQCQEACEDQGEYSQKHGLRYMNCSSSEDKGEEASVVKGIIERKWTDYDGLY